MKLRILGNSIRLRLSKSEVERIANNDAVLETCSFRQGDTLTYKLASNSEAYDITASFSNKEISIIIPEKQATAWASSDEVSLVVILPNASPEGLKILVEKDFKCLVDRPEEDEADLFQNPKSTTRNT